MTGRSRARVRNAKSVTLHGHRFDSKAEGERYLELRDREISGRIRKLELQPRFILQPTFRDPSTGEHVAALTYTADFRYLERIGDDWRTIIEDVKGWQTEESALRWKILRYRLRSTDIVCRLHQVGRGRKKVKGKR